jgi:hypothetical protein
MSKFLLRFFTLALLVALSGCSLFHKKKPETASHIYEGDAPTIKFSDKPEAPGGEIHAY